MSISTQKIITHLREMEEIASGLCKKYKGSALYAEQLRTARFNRKTAEKIARLYDGKEEQ